MKNFNLLPHIYFGSPRIVFSLAELQKYLKKKGDSNWLQKFSLNSKHFSRTFNVNFPPTKTQVLNRARVLRKISVVSIINCG